MKAQFLRLPIHTCGTEIEIIRGKHLIYLKRFFFLWEEIFRLAATEFKSKRRPVFYLW